MIADSINQAMRGGANPDSIVSEIEKQNPDKAQSFQAARAKGASSQDILSEIMRQNADPYMTGNPLTSPITQKQGTPQGQDQASLPQIGSTIAKGIVNLPTSIARNTGQFGSSLLNVLNPDMSKNTVANIANLGAGALERGVGALTGNKTLQNVQSQEAQVFDNVAKQLKDRYGSVENLKRTIAEDPAGFLFDVATVAEGGGGLLKKAGISAGGTIADIGKTINPVRIGLQAAGDTISAVGKKVQAPFAASADTAAIKAFKDQGITPPVSAVTKSKAVQGLEAIQSKGMFGQPIQNRYMAAANAVNDAAKTAVESITPKSLTDLPTAGNIIKNSFSKFVDTFHETKSTLYDAFAKESGKLPAVTNATSQALDEILQHKGAVIGGASDAKFFENLKSSLTETPRMADLRKAGINPKITGEGAPNYTFDNLKATRTQIGNMLKNSNDVVATGNKAELGRLYAALSDDMDATVTAKDTALGARFKDINDYYKNNLQAINSKVGTYIENAPPEKIVGNFVKPNNVSALSDLKNLVGQDSFQRVTDSFLGDVIKKSTGEAGMIDTKAFLKQIQRFDTPTLKAILDPEQYAHLQEVVKNLDQIDHLQEYLKRGQKIGAGSQTAFLNAIEHYKALPFLAGGFELASLPGAAAGVLAYIAGDVGLSKFLTSESGMKFFTTGFKGISNLGAKVSAAGGSAAVRATPLISKTQ